MSILSTLKTTISSHLGLFALVIKRDVEEQEWQFTLNKEFEPWNTNVRKDFVRKGYGGFGIAAGGRYLR